MRRSSGDSAIHMLASMATTSPPATPHNHGHLPNTTPSAATTAVAAIEDTASASLLSKKLSSSFPHLAIRQPPLRPQPRRQPDPDQLACASSSGAGQPVAMAEVPA
jgi:hypothetical protein